ncbi:tetraacyldisaccharide 4'-kinase [Lacinutrix venerupis]|uniref:Tetraacyldisaccharide 4'-kinase n=1 Tax=Lacinutrix venerupis TaxID=1486034 RepID=A0AAC9LMK2_9FLAO|nr:tetraacyldisaccharide 4'-kinase [Lacinutrix venerupis]APX99446.1 tetraacyldisaccharide 4'-kinase [Lacinutrix venerupis]
MKFIRLLLLPIVPIYFIVTWCRNKLYDLGMKKSKNYNFPIICVGNLSAGGTGKTPMVEYLIKLLNENYNLATLSRGYGRKTKGFVLASENSTANTLGDEPFQFYNKFKNSIRVSVDENRQRGILNLRALNNKPELIILDDAYQHRKVEAKLNILLTTYSNLYAKDIVLPTGNLREPREGAKRAQIIVVTKCPDNLSEEKKVSIIAELRPKDYQHVFFSSISYAKEVIGNSGVVALNNLKEFTLVTGIANAKPLVVFLKNSGLNFNHLEFSDHHNFSKKEIESIAKNNLIITTEKDYVRLIAEPTLSNKLFYLPIKIAIDRQIDFNNLVKAAIKC